MARDHVETIVVKQRFHLLRQKITQCESHLLNVLPAIFHLATTEEDLAMELVSFLNYLTGTLSTTRRSDPSASVKRAPVAGS